MAILGFLGTAWAYLSTRFVQLASGAAGYAVLAIVLITLGTLGFKSFENALISGAVAGRDLIWTKKVDVANDKARADQKKLDDAVRKAGDDERAKLESQLDAERERTAEREQQIARMKSDPVCIPADMER